MLHLSKQILVDQEISLAVITPKLVEARRNLSQEKKGDELRFGYKLHSSIDINYGLIRDIETTTASLHDSQVDLSVEGETILLGQGYFGVPAKGIDFT